MSDNNKTFSSSIFLEEVYNRLGYAEGVLLNAVTQPKPNSIEYDHWLEKGEWLSLAEKVNAKKIFFVRNDPVIVFSEINSIPDEGKLLEILRRIWCMARPQYLFLAFPGELQVYSLNHPPAKRIEDWQPLEVVKSIAEVSEKLQVYRREKIESGILLEDKRFGTINNRADKRLIQDLKFVRSALLENGLSERYAHALIGRSIFIRYLEDRGVLTFEYFRKIASNNQLWNDLLGQASHQSEYIVNLEERFYHRFLKNKELTYALFEKLSDDFNGDMFPKDIDEKKAVKQVHLDLLCSFLLGDSQTEQLHLFFWAYEFDVIPIELISSIYEEFYQKYREDDKGTHYTPSVLVEYILSQLLPEGQLAKTPKILDPACGSGIFLVEAFRRIVRYQMKQKKRLLTSKELKQIIRNQIKGIEINKEAIHIAAFSLYLAYLHYQHPPDILAQINELDEYQKPLPHLIYGKVQEEDINHFHTLFNANTFDLSTNEKVELEKKLEQSEKFKGRADILRLLSSSATLPLSLKSFDIIIGNPPWGFQKATSKEAQIAQTQTLNWCKVFGWTIGDKELSQAFIARTLSLLKEGGDCGFLVSTGILLKRHPNSLKFRYRWLSESIINTVVNFTQVRTAFFSGAIAPFVFTHFTSNKPKPEHWIHYWSAKKTEIVDKVQSVVLSKPDLRQVKQDEIKENFTLWKIYWWGNHRDSSFIQTLSVEKSLLDLAQKRGWSHGRGFVGAFPAGDHYTSDWFQSYKELPIRSFRRYGTIKNTELLDAPKIVHRLGHPDIYSGWRLLIKRGITEKNTTGRIEARLEEKSYCFRHSLHGVRVDNAKDWERKTLIGILWSSLARYFFFITASSWGTWHHEIHHEEVMNLPIRFPRDKELRKRIVEVVDELQSWNLPSSTSLFEFGSQNELSKLEHDLDKAIFELYDLSESEQDLILDMCEYGLDFFYNHTKSLARECLEKFPTEKLGTFDKLPKKRELEKGLEGYLYAFLKMWNRELEPAGEFYWQIIRPESVPMLAVVFITKEKETPFSVSSSDDVYEWINVLKVCDKTLINPISHRIYIEGMVRAVTDNNIIIIKRNERRLWTRSMAREDAEATMLQAIRLQEVIRE